MGFRLSSPSAVGERKCEGFRVLSAAMAHSAGMKVVSIFSFFPFFPLLKMQCNTTDACTSARPQQPIRHPKHDHICKARSMSIMFGRVCNTLSCLHNNLPGWQTSLPSSSHHHSPPVWTTTFCCHMISTGRCRTSSWPPRLVLWIARAEVAPPVPVPAAGSCCCSCASWNSVKPNGPDWRFVSSL